MKKATEQDIKVSAITSKLSIATFFSYLLIDLKLAFHPDTTFGEYIDDEEHPVFSTERAKELNDIMDACIDLCDKKEWDIYEIGMNTTHVVFMDAWEEDLNKLDGDADDADEKLSAHHDVQQQYFKTFGLPHDIDPQINYDNAYRLIAFDTPLDAFRGMKKVVTNKTYIAEFFFEQNGDQKWGEDEASRMVALYKYDKGGYIVEDAPGEFTMPMGSDEPRGTLEELEIKLFEWFQDEA